MNGGGGCSYKGNAPIGRADGSHPLVTGLAIDAARGCYQQRDGRGDDEGALAGGSGLDQRLRQRP